MPETIGALILSAISVSATAGFTIAGVSITYASIVGTAVLAAASFALSSSLLPSAPKPDGQLALQQAVPFRRRGYGRMKLGGWFIFWTSVTGTLYQLIAVLAHEIDAIEEYWVSDRRVALDSNNFVIAVTAPGNADHNQFNPDGAHVVQILTSLGAAGKIAYAALTSAFAGIWTSAHIGVGIADALLITKGVKSSIFSTVYPGGQQALRLVVRGAKILDPRTSITAWTDNAVCVLLDYLTNQDGWRIDPSIFLTGMGGAVTLESADVCDELVNLKTGGTEKRYRIWGFYDYNEEPRQVLGRMLAACAGWLQPFPDGTIGINVGRWIDPGFTITDEMILGFDVQHFVGEFDAINEVRATFPYPANDYQDTETQPWQDAADIARRGYIKSTSLDARHCPSFTQTRRIQKIGFHEASPEFSIQLTLSAAGLAARNRRFLNLAMTQLGLTGSFRVTSFVANLQTGVCTVGLASFGADAYTWDPDTEEGDPPLIPVDSSSDGVIETPQNLTINVETRTISGSQAGPVMVVMCDAPIDRTDLQVKFEYQLDGNDSWTVLSQGTQTYQTETAILGDGTYNVRASFFTSSNVQSPFAEVDGVLVSASVAAPGPPTGLAAGVVSTTVTITFTDPNSANFYAARVWRSAINTFGTATDISGPILGSPNQAVSYPDTPGTGTWYYWATAESSSGNRSSPAGSVTATV